MNSMQPQEQATNGTRTRASGGPLALVRIIARLNVGGPAIQAISLTRLLTPRGYRTKLIRGTESPDEGSMDYLARRLDVEPTLVGALRRDPGLHDVKALLELVRIVRRERPALVHTHAAKAGALGRVAALAARPGARPIIVHTYHGHSLSGYFSSRRARLYRGIERWLARRSDALVAVSAEVRDDLVRLGVAPRERFTVVPLGLDLAAFLDDEHRSERSRALRAEWGLSPDDDVVTLVARLVPIKRVDRFLRVAALVLAERPATRFVVVGDGELHAELVGSAAACALGDRLVWAGFRRDMPDVCFASDIVVLTSDNEGTPVSLIEAQAASVPVVGTDVGGTRSVVRDGVTGLLADATDEAGFATAVARLLADPGLRAQMAAAGRKHASGAFAVERLVDDLDALYRRLVASPQGKTPRRRAQTSPSARGSQGGSGPVA